MVFFEGKLIEFHSKMTHKRTEFLGHLGSKIKDGSRMIIGCSPRLQSLRTRIRLNVKLFGTIQFRMNHFSDENQAIQFGDIINGNLVVPILKQHNL